LPACFRPVLIKCYCLQTAANRQQRALPPGRIWQENSSTPHFWYRDNKTLHRVDYDDSQSLRLKYKLARSLGAGGVGMWTASAIRYNVTDKDGVDEGKTFWEDLKVFTEPRIKSDDAQRATSCNSSSVRVSKILNYDSGPFGNSTPADYKLWDWSRLTDRLTF
jgi:hypothetical protein